MDQNPSPPAIAGLTALIVLFFLTVPTFLKLFENVRSKLKPTDYEDVHKLYEDEDGAATEESQKEYSAALPKYLVLSSTIIGFLASTATAVITTVMPMTTMYLNNWLLFSSWVHQRSSNLKGTLTANKSTVPSGYRNGVCRCRPRLQEEIRLWQIECDGLHCNIRSPWRPIWRHSLLQ